MLHVLRQGRGFQVHAGDFLGGLRVDGLAAVDIDHTDQGMGVQLALGFKALIIVDVFVIPAEDAGMHLKLLIGAQFADIGNFRIGHHHVAAGFDHAVEAAGDHRMFQPAAIHEFQVLGIVQMHIQVDIQQADPEFQGDNIK